LSYRPKLRRAFSFLEVQFAFVLLSISVAGLVPLIVMQTKHVRLLESQLEPDVVHYLLPSQNVWARRLGVPAKLSPSLVTAISYPESGHINFQRPQDPTPGSFEGNLYRSDVGGTFGNAGDGYWYGWSASTISATRNLDLPNSPDERYDTFIYMQKLGSVSWEVAVPKGIYQVRIVAGDPSAIDSLFNINVELVPAVVGKPTLVKRWVEGTIIVPVVDGRLTISNGLLAVNNKLCFVDYSKLESANVIEVNSITRSVNTNEVSALVELRFDD
jgi:hypothetical protein